MSEEESALLAQLRARLTSPAPDHPSFTGAPLSLDGLTSASVAALWPLVMQQFRAPLNTATQAAARAIFNQARERDWLPQLEADVAIAEVRRLLDDKSTHSIFRHKPAFVTRRVDPATLIELQRMIREHYADSPFVAMELEAFRQMKIMTLLALDRQPNAFTFPPPDPAPLLVEEAAYVEFARTALTEAHRQVCDVHDGKTPYVADGLFSVMDSPTLATAARVASLRDEPWFREIIPSLLPKLCVAPTDAKTAPSQSLSIALGHSIASTPTPESVQALRDALGIVRHAGLKKKLSRNLKPAERALAARPEMSLRLVQDMKPGKRGQAVLAASLEASFWHERGLSWKEWRSNLADTEAGAPFARSLIWNVRDPSGRVFSVMSDGNPEHPSMIDSHEKPVDIDATSTISLWHPLHASDAEREAWRSLIHERQIRQPIRQAFREYYVPLAEELSSDHSEAFSGYSLSLVPLIGLARREGWNIEKDEGLLREFAGFHVNFGVGASLYPGVSGYADSSWMTFLKRDGAKWVRLLVADVPPVVFSEMCRAVDLLVSVTSFAVEDGTSHMTLTVGDLGVQLASEPRKEHPPVPAHPRVRRMMHVSHLSNLNRSDMAQTRRNVLERALGKQIAAGTVLIDERHLRVGTHAIHLTTGRVTREGTPVELQISKTRTKMAAVPWLPYDEALLQKIVASVEAVLGLAPDQ